MTVTDFRKHVEENEPMLWMCDCGNCAFSIYANGSVQCCKCDTMQTVDSHYQHVAKWTRKVETPNDQN